MLNVLPVFKVLEDTNSRTEKTRLLESLSGKSKDRAIYLLDTAMNPFRTYGITAPEVRGEGTLADLDIEFDYFKGLVSKLETRELSGNAALTAVSLFLKSCTPNSATWYRRILNHKGPNGVGESTIQAGLGYIVPAFHCQLASAWEGQEPPQNAIIEPKIDGMRCLLILDPKDPRALSRGGKPLQNMDKILQGCLKIAEDIVLDGELYADSWEASITAGKSAGSKVKKNLWLFDAIPLADFRANKSELKLEHRKAIVEKFRGVDGVVVVPWQKVTTPEEVVEITHFFVKEGFEGSILKDFDAPYLFNRGDAWLKVKFFVDSELQVIDMYEGLGRLQGMMGGVVVDVKGVSVRVGSGYKDEQRKHYWANRDDIIGKKVTVQYQRLSPDGSLIFPIFKGVREEE